MTRIISFMLLAIFVLSNDKEVLASSEAKGREIDLVLSGSGTRYPVYVGAIRALLEKDYQIKMVAGVNGGAIVAAALCSGFIDKETLPEEILRRITYQRKYHPFERWENLYSLIANLGFSSGNDYEAFFDRVFEGKTMADLAIPMTIYGTDIWNQKVVVFTNKDPLKISRVLRMTTSVPILFTPIKYEGGLIVDGGIGATFPIDAFKDGARPIVDIQLKAPSVLPKNVTSPDEVPLLQYIKLVLLTVFISLENEHIKQVPPPGAEVITLDTGSFARIDLDITVKERIQLFESGYKRCRKG